MEFLKDYEEETESPYFFKDGVDLEVPGQSLARPLDVLSLRKSGRLGRSVTVLDALYKYPFLDRCSLEACLHGGKTPAISDRQVWDCLNFLMDGEIVHPVKYGDFRFYVLRDGARKQLSEAKDFSVTTPDLTDKSRVLETAALCRWHAHFTAGGNVGANVIGQTMKFAGKTAIVDSYLEFRRSVRYRVFAFASPRGSRFEDFAEKLSAFSELQRESARRGLVTLTVIVASSVTEAEAIDRMLGAMDAFRGRRFYYALDSRRGKDAYGLAGLRYFESEGGEVALRSVSIE